MRLLAPLLTLALALGTALGCGFTNSQIWLAMREASDPSFDRVYLSMLVPHYASMHKLGEEYLPYAKDPAMKRWVEGMMADRKARLEEINRLLKNLGGDKPVTKEIMQIEMDADLDQLSLDLGKPGVRDTFANVISTNLATSVNLSQIALQRSKNRAVLELARRVRDGETKRAEQLQLVMLGR
ncbi:hypothetical protein Mterra_01623 [Calidithermus terrae]|uniref:DUF305 domain-containing protein n=1 Tax=Calidithermus terrae TaxID=1408545 RepID=A0A399EM02_9DEIN|nr:hypothetical protein [Calidithermus terrae]RIH85764.1 hypothetical protein Mterra_01623 [Calidithermus terrae]